MTKHREYPLGHGRICRAGHRDCGGADMSLRQKYEELLFAVARKFEGESRHETALRYIKEREALAAGTRSAETPSAAQSEGCQSGAAKTAQRPKDTA